MRTKICSIGLIVIVILAMQSAPALCEEAFTINSVTEVEIPSAGADTVFGWTFQVPGSTSIFVTHVGVYDYAGDGLASDHAVGIWYYDYDTVEWVELLLPTVPAGTSAELIDGYRYVALDTPIELTPNPGATEVPPTQSAYTIGVLFPTGNGDEWIELADVSFDPSGTVVTWSSTSLPGQYSRKSPSSTLVRPGSVSGSSVTTDQQGLQVNFKFTTNVTPHIVGLIEVVADMNLQQGIDNSLDAKLDAALNALDDVNVNNDVAALNSLQAFINAVEAQRDNKLTNDQANALIEEAQKVINLLIP